MRAETRRAALGFSSELVLLAALVGGFLSLYTGPFAAPTSAIVPHVKMVASFVLAFVALRLGAHLLFGDGRGARVASAFVLWALLAVLGSYYSLVLVGLSSWGRVVSWKLISTYVPQSGTLLEVMGIPSIAAITAVALAAASTLLLAWWWMGVGDWTRLAARRARKLTILAIVVCGLGIAAAQVLVLATEPPAAQQEPISLTFRPELGTAMMQNNVGGANSVADSRDRQARESYRPAPRDDLPNVVLIVGDALRGDHMGVLGYERDTTPFLSSLDQPGRMLKARAMRAVCGESSCGLMAIASSSYVHTLGSRPFTLIEALKLHGYRTRMLLGGDHTNFYSLREAYGPVDDYFDGSMASKSYMNDDRLVLDHAARLPRWEGSRPEYLQFHLMSTHGIGQRFETESYSPARHYYYRRATDGSYDERSRDIEAINYYDNGMRQFDAVTARLLHLLGERGYLHDALVLIVGDHGEMLGEEGEYKHAWSVREGALNIPMLMIGYGRTLSVTAPADALSSQLDIAPTLLREIGIPAPASWFGEALHAAPSRKFIHFQQGTRVGAYDVRDPAKAWKLWQDTWLDTEYLSVIEGGTERGVTPDEFTTQRMRRMRAELAGSIATILGKEKADPFRVMLDSRDKQPVSGETR